MHHGGDSFSHLESDSDNMLLFRRFKFLWIRVILLITGSGNKQTQSACIVKGHSTDFTHEDQFTIK